MLIVASGWVTKSMELATRDDNAHRGKGAGEEGNGLGNER